MNAGEMFGQLALTYSQKRQASIFNHKKNSIVAFIDRNDYQRLMQQLVKQEINRQMSVLKNNQFFSNLSNNKLSNFREFIKEINPCVGKVLYCEDDDINGVYLIRKGSLKYQKITEFTIPIECKTRNKWFKDQVKGNGINRKKGLKDIALFENNDIVGFEELMREFLTIRKQE
jgi:CRP-like cAMP-binding protein